MRISLCGFRPGRSIAPTAEHERGDHKDAPATWTVMPSVWVEVEQPRRVRIASQSCPPPWLPLRLRGAALKRPGIGDIRGEVDEAFRRPTSSPPPSEPVVRCAKREPRRRSGRSPAAASRQWS